MHIVDRPITRYCSRKEQELVKLFRIHPLRTMINHSKLFSRTNWVAKNNRHHLILPRISPRSSLGLACARHQPIGRLKHKVNPLTCSLCRPIHKMTSLLRIITQLLTVSVCVEADHRASPQCTLLACLPYWVISLSQSRCSSLLSLSHFSLQQFLSLKHFWSWEGFI